MSVAGTWLREESIVTIIRRWAWRAGVALLVGSGAGLAGCASSSSGCPAGFEDCDGVCVNPLVDSRNCGACGTVCGAGELCDGAGACALSCQPGLLDCDGTCTDPDTSNLYCGAADSCTGDSAGVVCGAGELCGGGACATSCPTGQLACDGRCVDPATDRAFCGARRNCADANAGTPCEAGEVCSAGECAVSCQAGLVECGGTCIDPNTSRAFCGAMGDCTGDDAGTDCADGEVCSAGTCALSCQGGLVECGGTCIDPNTDRTFCGASGMCAGGDAGTTCADGQVCSLGRCALSCQAGLLACGGTCVDPDTSRSFCGASGNCAGGNAGVMCAPGQICADGGCALSCQAGLVACDGTCIDPDSNPDFCGASDDCAAGNAGEACADDEYCDEGTCAATMSGGDGPRLLFDSIPGGGTSSTTRGVGNSCGSQIRVGSSDVLVTNIGVRYDLTSASGNLKFLIWEHATHTLVYESAPKAFTDSGFTWFTSNDFFYVLEAGVIYDIGAIANVGSIQRFDGTANTLNGLTSIASNPNWTNFATPSFSGHAGADCGVQITGFTLSDL